MTVKTLENIDLVQSNPIYFGIYPDIYENFPSDELVEQSHTPVSEVCVSSVISAPQVTSQDSDFSEIPDIQETTHQVPCGEHSIFDPAHKVPAFEKAVYLKVNEHSHWESGVSHALSLRHLSELLNVKSHSQVHRALKWLIENGWLKVEGKRKTDGAYFYRVIHHKCEPQDTPVDRDGRPQKCAVPRGAGSPSQLLVDGKITWRMFVDWTVRKIHSCWTSGIVSMTVREASKLMKLSVQTISENAKKMGKLGMVKRLSEKFRLSVYQMFPKPYPERRERSLEECASKKAMKLINGWYYSFNGLWRFQRETFWLQMCEHGGRWRDSNMEELFSINKSIHRDFTDYMYHLKMLYGNTAQI
ncbi:MAG: hypothetical protein OXM61_07490 [Candidatus Poribacteria bacterium]|nr:hypothetical protein [Candidatus Poribacteria bacterium]